jgi:serine/threonine protein kinase
MKSRPASARPGGGLDRVDSAVQLLEEEWRRYGDVRLEKFWADHIRDGAVDPTDSLVYLAALIKADLKLRFDQGQIPTAAGYLLAFPELLGSERHVLSLVYEEYCLNEERGLTPDADSFCERYPELGAALAVQLRYHRVFSKAAGLKHSLPRFPEPGENFEEFHLLSDLGRGGTSRVFLARDLSLGGKRVALKVTLDRGQEPKVQGALDHPHIVPVNAVIYPLEGALCGLSMPFRPGLPLDEVIRRVNPAAHPARAMLLWDVLEQEPATGASPGAAPGKRMPLPKPSGGRLGPRGDGWEGFPARGTYAQGAAWIVMIVSRALQYAHGKETFHRDVKPANVLLTLLNGPQLLDFNLAESPHSADRARAVLRGGTPPYMAPEQIQAFLNPEERSKVGAQADVYSLGLVLRELLTGQMPEMPASGLSPARELLYLLDRRPLLDVAVRRVNPSVPHSLEAIVAKCLAISLEDRYPSAEALAQDLERFTKHQPLLHAQNPSRRERLANWATRRRAVLVAAACIMALGVTAALAVNAGVSLSRASGNRPVAVQPSVDTLPLFQAAVEYAMEGLRLNNGKRQSSPALERAVESLRELEMEYPQSSLIKLYLSLACDALAIGEKDKKKDQAKDYLNKALVAASGDLPTLAAWTKTHFELGYCLVDLVFADIIRVDQYASDYDADNPADDEEVRDALLKRTSYELARDALRLAERLGTDYPRMKFLLAKTEQFFGNNESAREQLSQLINQARENGIDDLTLFYCRELRAWITCQMVEILKDKDQVDDGTLELVKEGQTDLEIYRHVLGNMKFKDEALKQYRALHDRARLTLTQAEVEVVLKKLPDAAQHLQDSRKMLARLNYLRDEAERSHQRVPKSATRLTERMDDLSKRLRAAGSGGGSSPRSSSSQAPRVGWNGG